MDPTSIGLSAVDMLQHVPIIGPYVATVAEACLAVSGVCALVATVLPVPTKTAGFYLSLYNVIHKIGGNFGMAKNILGPAASQVAK